MSRQATRRARLGRVTAALVVLGLVVGTWGADVLARRGAEQLVAQDVQSATGSPQPPAVTVDGRFFLPQVLRGAYPHVHVRVDDLRSGPLVVGQVDADLDDVRVPFHDVLLRNVRTIGIGHSVETAHLAYPAVNAYLDATGRPLRLSHRPGQDGVTATADVEVLDQTVEATADLGLDVTDAGLRLTPRSVDSSNQRLSDLASLLLTQRLTVTVPLADLPFAQHLTAVDVTDDGLVVHAAGEAVVLEP